MVPQKKRMNSKVRRARNPVGKSKRDDLVSARKKVCASGKQAWDTSMDAKIFLVSARVDKPMRVYECNLCKRWHITSQATMMTASNVVPERPVYRAPKNLAEITAFYDRMKS